MSVPKHANRLIDAASPYLLQHAHNPVDWYPWGEEALARAKREDKPIFLSIGYSACHWCHVMERESFEDEETARIMNEHFVSIKVDREERPDLDEIYMHAVQLMTGSGGWPLSVFLTPDLEPFYGGTYFPPRDMGGRASFPRVLLAAAQAYREQRERLGEVTRQISEALRKAAAADAAGAAPDAGLIEDATSELGDQFDQEWGGFGRAPKFPQAAAIGLLLRHHHRTGDGETRRMATHTLDRMAAGGIYDQLGGGFHRYAVDREWLVPHFEKMLYDNALLAGVYLDAFQLTGSPLYRRVAGETLDYLLREMRDESGGFHSAQDADTEGAEGAYYLWDLAEANDLLSGDDAEICRRYYGMTESGNFEGRNTLHVPLPAAEFAEQWVIPQPELEERLARVRATLLERRSQRAPPAKDDKVLADWNGLAISAFARGYQVLGVEAYREAAENAARFVLTSMRPDGRLLHAHRGGRSHINGFLDDCAFVTQGVLDLYEATFDSSWIEHARSLAREMIERFWDDQSGGFYLTAADQSDVIARTRKAHDGSIPSGNAAAAHALLRLATLTGDAEYRERAERTLAAFGAQMQRSPTAFAGMLAALDLHLGPVTEIVIAGEAGDAGGRGLLDAVSTIYLPNKVVALADPEARPAAAIPPLESKPMVGGRATAYVCQGNQCRPPVTDAEALRRLLAGR